MSRIDESKLAMISGLKTLSSKWPCAPPKVIAVWLPITCASPAARSTVLLVVVVVLLLLLSCCCCYCVGPAHKPS